MTARKIVLIWGVLPSLLPAILLWGALSGRSVPSFRDQSDFFYPTHRYTAQRLLRRELPLWNPLSGNGESWIANGQNEIFYPPALLFLLGNGARAAGIFLMFHFIVAYLLFFGFVRARDRTVAAAATGAGLYAYSGVAVSLSIYWNHFAGMSWIPGLAWAAQLGLKTRRQRCAFAAALALTLLAGSPEAALFGLLISLFIFFEERRREEAARNEQGYTRLRSFGNWCTAALGGACLSAAVLFPLLEALRRGPPRASVAGGGLSLAQVASVLFTPSLSPVPWLPEGSGFFQSLYLSVPMLAAAAAAFLLPERKREKILWAGAAGLALAAALAASRLPFRYPAKLVILSVFALAALAAEGFEALRFSAASPGRRALGLGVVAATSLGAALLTATPAERMTVALGGGLLAAAAFDFPPRLRGVLLGLAASLLSAHLVIAAAPLPRFASLAAFEKPPKPPRGKVLTSQDELLAGWANRVLPDEEGRVRRQIDSLEGYSNLPFGLAKARTASALPTREARDFATALENARDLTRPAAVAGCGEVRFPRGDTVARVIVLSPLSGASFFFREEKAPPPGLALEEIDSGHFDSSRVLFVERLAGLAPGGRTSAIASTVSETPERVEYSVALSRDAWMYRAQSWDPWWRAAIDGKPAEIVRANGVFSAVLVPAGNHGVVWRYRPLPFYVGAAVSLLALLYWVSASLSGEPAVRTRRL
jgi:hypothetical protein